MFIIACRSFHLLPFRYNLWPHVFLMHISYLTFMVFCSPATLFSFLSDPSLSLPAWLFRLCQLHPVVGDLSVCVSSPDHDPVSSNHICNCSQIFFTWSFHRHLKLDITNYYPILLAPSFIGFFSSLFSTWLLINNLYRQPNQQHGCHSRFLFHTQFPISNQSQSPLNVLYWYLLSASSSPSPLYHSSL